MNEATRDENNRKIAEWLLVDCKGPVDSAADLHPKYMLDFYTSESANAMLLEAMPQVCLTHVTKLSSAFDAWRCWPNYMEHNRFVDNPDRKTAICFAFIAWKESQKNLDI